MLQPLFPVTQQFQAKNGSNLVSGKIYIYFQGRTALATTYHDEEGTVVNSNPVLLDNNGRATVFADSAYAYTIVVCDYYGKELFSQDITLHDVTETADEITIIGSDGSILINRTTADNVKTFDLYANTNIIATKQSVDDLASRVSTNEDDIEDIKGGIEDIGTALSNKKDKQNAKTFTGSVTKTVKKITQNANGEMNVEFEDIDLPNDVTITSSDNSINVTDDGEGNFDLTLNTGDVDDTWAHFKNDNTWYNINTINYTDVSSGLSLAEGELISSMSASLPAGLYFFSAELAYNSYTAEDTYQKIDLKIMYGDTALRAESFNFDKATPNGVFQTEWSSGLFKLESAGNIAIKLALGASSFASTYNNQVKVSHFFIRKIDESAIGGGSGSGDNDKVAVDANATAGYLEDVLVSDSDLVSLVKSGNTLRVNVNTEYSADPKLSTMNESQINSAIANYGNYALQDGYSELTWGDTSYTSYQWINASVYQMVRLSDAQGTITKCNLALCGSLAFSDPKPCFNIGIFSTDGTLLGQSGVKYYGTDFNSDEELCTVDMIEASEGSLSIQRNTRYIIMLWSCGLQIAGLDKSTNYNYVYDLNLRQNLQGTISSPSWPAISDISTRASVVPYITFGAAALS